MSLSSKAMIVTLNVSCWTARKQDKRVSAEVDANHNAKDAGRYNKLLIDKSHLDPLTSHAGAIRQYHYKMTLPWMDNGGRLLPAKLFFTYQQEMDRLKTQYTALVDTFIATYDTQLVQQARTRLGTLYDPEDYPLGHELRSKFGVEIDIANVPDASDFRVEVGDAERKRIQEEMTAKLTKRQTDAMNSAWQRVRERVELIHTRLSADKAVVHESLIDGARELLEVLPGLNVTDDPKLADVAEQITNNLLVDIWTLRNSKRARLEVANKAQTILKLIPAAGSA
jgi:hypothetical protein